METTGHSSDGGYDYQFVDTPLDRVVCVICHLPSRDPHMTECCGHVFCKSCLDKAKATRYASCSMCKDDDFNTFCNKQINREVLSIRVYCTNKEKGCEWEGEIRDISIHLENSDGCQFEEVECPNECKELIQRQYLGSHVKSKCSHREVECQYCCEKVKLLFADGLHLEECPKLPLPCPNGCEKIEMILREDMEAHRKDCSLELIQCEYHSVGCDMKITRKRKPEHDEENVKKHLHLTKVELASTKSELASTNNRVTNLEMMIKTLIGSSGTDLGTLCSNPLLVASQARWSIHLAALEATSLLDEQTSPVIMKMTNFHEYEIDESPDWYKHFFSHERGYRMQIWINPGLPEHMELSMYITHGPYDEDLRWPLRAKFQITLLNQITDCEHHTVTMAYDENTPNMSADRRFEEDEDLCYPVECKLISKRDLHKITPTCAYVRNDCILLKVCKL